MDKKKIIGHTLDELITDMVLHFQKYDVTEEMLCAYIGKNLEAFNEKDVLKLRKVYTSLKDGIVGNDYFLQKLKDGVAAPAPEQEEATPETKARSKKKPAPQPDPEQEAVGLDDI